MKAIHNIPRLLLILTALSPCVVVSQDVVDIGIFENPESTVFTVKARPTYTIAGQALTNAQLTIRWEQTSGVTSLAWLGTSVGLVPQGDAIQAGGYNYQVYASTGGGNLNWNAGTEYTILTVAPDNQDFNCSRFEIALDDWTAANNGDYYFEVVGEDRTGTRYEPYVNYGSEGGYVDGDTSIYLGAGTGLLTLENYNGLVLTWQRNANQSGWVDIQNTAGLGSYEEIPSPDGIYQYRAVVKLGSCPAANSAPATITVELLAVWTGMQDTSWDNFANWNSVGVPDPYTDALIPNVSAGNNPVIAAIAFAKKMTVSQGASVTVQPGGELTLSGDFTNDGTLEIFSDFTGTGSFVNAGAINGSGNFICHVANHTGIHLISPPVPGMVAGPLATQQNLYVWDEELQHWFLTFDPLQPLETLTGYEYVSTILGQDIIFHGDSFHSGILSMILTNNGNNFGHSGGFNAVGNPYPSAVSWESDDGWVLNRVDPAIYVYNGDAQNFGTYIKGDPGSSTLGIDSIISAGQGFFVHVNHEYSSGEIAVNNNARLHSHGNILKSGRTRTDEPLIRLAVSLDPAFEGQRDEVLVRFREGATGYFDQAQDAYDIAGLAFGPQLFTRCPDTLRLAVNTLPPLSENISIPMGFMPVQTGNFIIKVTEMSGFGPDTMVLLEDLKWDQIYRLTEGTVLPMLSFPEDDIDRFILHFQPDPVMLPEPSGHISLSVSNYEGYIQITSLDHCPFGPILVTDIAGRIIHQSSCLTDRQTIHFDHPRGLYLLHVNQSTGPCVVKFLY